MQSGINKVVFIKEYKDNSGIEFLRRAGIEVVQIEDVSDGAE